MAASATPIEVSSAAPPTQHYHSFDVLRNYHDQKNLFDPSVTGAISIDGQFLNSTAQAHDLMHMSDDESRQLQQALPWLPHVRYETAIHVVV